ncbi:MAG: hypothetical protein ACFFD4_17060 [Candidatus Odinarchaeota archaeon]
MNELLLVAKPPRGGDFLDIAKRIEQEKKFLEPEKASLEAIKATVSLFQREVENISLVKGYRIVDVVAAGSAPRKTFLPGKLEVDLFARLEKARSKEDLESFIHDVAPLLAERLGIEFILKYAENPYGHFLLPLALLNLPPVHGQDRIQVDLVVTVHTTREALPAALKISGMARTPFHVEYLAKAITDDLATEVRLFKHWLKLKRIYGQVSFTGFLAELLVIKFGSFLSILQNAEQISRLKQDFHGRAIAGLEKKFNFPLVLITDPTDPDRNAAAGITGTLGEIKMKRFVSEARKSLAEPETMFEPLKPPSERLEAVIHFGKEIINPDEVFTRLGRIAVKTSNQMKQEGYQLTDVFIEPDQSKFILVFENYFLAVIERKGPPVKAKRHADKFLKKHREVVTRDGHLYSLVNNRFHSAREAMDHYIGSNKSCQSHEIKYYPPEKAS